MNTVARRRIVEVIGKSEEDVEEVFNFLSKVLEVHGLCIGYETEEVHAYHCRHAVKAGTVCDNKDCACYQESCTGLSCKEYRL